MLAGGLAWARTAALPVVPRGPGRCIGMPLAELLGFLPCGFKVRAREPAILDADLVDSGFG